MSDVPAGSRSSLDPRVGLQSVRGEDDERRPEKRGDRRDLSRVAAPAQEPDRTAAVRTFRWELTA